MMQWLREEKWHTLDGKTIRVRDMDDRHIANLLKFLSHYENHPARDTFIPVALGQECTIRKLSVPFLKGAPYPCVNESGEEVIWDYDKDCEVPYHHVFKRPKPALRRQFLLFGPPGPGKHKSDFFAHMSAPPGTFKDLAAEIANDNLKEEEHDEGPDCGGCETCDQVFAGAPHRQRRIQGHKCYCPAENFSANGIGCQCGGV